MDHAAFLAAVRRRLRRALALDGAARVLGALVGLLLLLTAADAWWFLPGWLRLGAVAGVLAVAAALAWRRLLRPLLVGMDDRALAALAERRLPLLAGRLFTAVDGLPLGGEAAALRAQLTPAAVAALVPARALPRRLAAVGALLALVAAIALAQPGLLRDGLLRLALPLSGADWQRRTRLSGEVERAVVAEDEAVRLRIRRSHPSPRFAAPVDVAWRGPGGGDLRRLPGLVGTAWDQALPLPPGRWLLSVASGDALPLELAVRVVRRPRLERVAVVVHPPAYAGRPDQTLDTLAVTALAGSRVEFTCRFAGEADRPPARAEAGLPPDGATLALAESDGAWRGGFVLRRSGELALTAADADGIALQPPARFPLQVEADRPPQAAIAGPRPRETVGPRALVALTVEARDDIGLADLALTGGVGPATGGAAGPPRELMRAEADPGERELVRRLTLDVGALAAPGMQLALVARARDRNDVDGPGVGESPPVVLRVVAEEELRQEFDRLLGEAREQVGRAREELAGGLARSERLGAAARLAAQAAERARELAAQVARRARENRLPGEDAAAAGGAAEVLAGQAAPALARAGDGDGAAARTADGALGEAERLLASLLQEGDLTRLLASLVARQEALGEETRGFVRAFLTRPLDGPAQALQGNLAARQGDLAEAEAGIERRILAASPKALGQAQELVRARPPAERLRSAAGDLAPAGARTRAAAAQQQALADMQRLLELLRGSDARGSLAEDVGRLAAEQERLSAALDRGEPPAALAPPQEDLQRRTAVLQGRLSGAAAERAAAAAQAQGGAAQAMQRGDRAAAGRDAAAAAALLREAQRALAPEEPRRAPEGPADPLAVLRELRTQQAALVADATALEQRSGGELGFDVRRALADIARRQGDIALRLREDVLRRLDGLAVARLAVARVGAAMQAAGDHFARPALGPRGLALGRRALAELTRLLAIVEARTAARRGARPPGGGDAQGAADGQRPPLPPSAELALLAAMQAEVAQATAADSPIDLAAAQAGLRDLVAAGVRAARPGSRGQELLERTRRAMASAAWRLERRDRGAATRDEQGAAEEALRRLLAEAGGQGDGGGGGGGGQPPPAAPSPGQPPPGGGAAEDQGQAPAQAGAPGAGRGAGAAASGVQVEESRGAFMNLPPILRDRLLEARDQGLTPHQREVFKAYLRNLEEGR